MEKDNTTIATEVLRLLKEENEKSETKSRQAIKRIYLLLLIMVLKRWLFLKKYSG